MDSILNSVKKMLGIDSSYCHFDPDIIMHINTVFMILNQMGVGPEKPYILTDDNATWDDFLAGSTGIEAVKSYVYAKVRLLFDPPQSGAVKEALNNVISELEWRLNVACDKG